MNKMQWMIPTALLWCLTAAPSSAEQSIEDSAARFIRHATDVQRDVAAPCMKGVKKVWLNPLIIDSNHNELSTNDIVALVESELRSIGLDVGNWEDAPISYPQLDCAIDVHESLDRVPDLPGLPSVPATEQYSVQLTYRDKITVDRNGTKTTADLWHYSQLASPHVQRAQAVPALMNELQKGIRYFKSTYLKGNAPEPPAS